MRLPGYEGGKVSEQNIETVKKGYAAFAAGDTETVFSLLDDDIEWIQPGNSAISGTYRGKAGFGELLGRLAQKPMTTSPSRFFADGDMVVVLTEVNADGETAAQADVFTLRDGKLVKALLIGDTALGERIWGTKP
jgi:uncharacterized protein